MRYIGIASPLHRGGLQGVFNLGGDSGAVEPVPVRPTNTRAPSITGVPKVGQTLTGDDGQWSGTLPISTARRWQRRQGDGSWAVISGATASTFVLREIDEGFTLRMQSQGSNIAGTSVWVNSAKTAVVAPADVVEPPDALPVTSRILFSGHSLVDAIFSASGDYRQHITTYHPDGPKNWRRNTIPGSTLEIRWDQRFGAPGEQYPDPVPGPFNPEDQYSPVLPGRDMQEFDALFIAEGGPLSVPLNVDSFNRSWASSLDYLNRWRGLASDMPVYFWTIWPAITADQQGVDPTWNLAPTDRTDIAPFLAFLDRYEKTAEQWCSYNGQQLVKIVPGHRLYWELYCRYHGLESRPPLPGNWADIWADDIHTNHLGSVFVSVMVYRWLFGEFPDASIVSARLAEAESNQGITAQDVFDVVTATLTYVQGTGVDLQEGTFVPPTPFWDVQNTAASPGVNIVGTFTPGEVLGPENGLWWDLAEQPEEMYALLQVSHTATNGDDVPIYCGSNPQWNVWDPKLFGLQMNVANAGESGGRVAVFDGAGTMAAPLDLMGGVGALRYLEVYIGPKGKRVRFLDNPSYWLGNFEPRTERALPTTKLGVNVEWNNYAMALTEGNFAIHAGLTYDYIPDDLTRMRLLKHLVGQVP